MIRLSQSYTVLFTSTVAGVGTAADATPVAVLYHNGAASGVSVTVSTTGTTGLYKAEFSTLATGDGWSERDTLEMYVTATIGGTSSYLAKVWSSTEFANTTAPLDASATQSATAAAIAAANLAQPGDEMSLTSENLTALFADVDVAGLVASVTAAFDEATDLPVQTIAADAATRTVAAIVANAQILALIADAASANAAALSIDAKLTSDRAAKLDRDLAHASDADTYKATVPTAEDIDTRLSTTHGSGSWGGGSGSSLTGPNAITVTITDSATDEPIEAATVRFYRTGASGSAPTNADGQAVFALESATWTVAISAAGYESKTASLVVSGDATPEFALDSITVSPPGTGGLCRVRVPVREASTAAAGARVEAQLVDENQAVGNDLVARSITRAKTDATGYADLLLPQGLTYQIEGFHGNHRFLSVEYTAPAENESYLAAGL